MELYMLDIGDIREEDLRLVRTLFPRRYERASRFVKRSDMLLSCASGLLIWRTLFIENESDILTDAAGKPYLLNGPSFSISHSHERCILAVGSCSIGADIERIDERNLSAAEAVLTERELEWMRVSPLERFHLLWTRKESIYKAHGGIDDPKTIDAFSSVYLNRYCLKSVIFDGYALSVFSDEEFEALEPVRLKLH